MRSRLFVCWSVLFFYSVAAVTVGETFDWDPTKRVPIREKMTTCAAFISPADPKVNDSVGVQIAKSHHIEDVKIQLQKAIEDRGRAGLIGSHLFVTGVEMKNERDTQSAYENMLQELGFQPGEIRVRILSIPRKTALRFTRESMQGVLERLIYFFPSLKRDYQSPLKAEIVSGIGSDVVIEAFNIAYLYQALPLTDANLTVGMHAGLIAGYSIYKKFMINWLLRPGSNNIESFIKQVSLSFPFVANYNIFGNFSKIVGFYQQHGWQATAARFPTELTTFATTQGFTIFLQTLFYNLVITKGVRAWENRQEGDERSKLARTVSNLVNIPILTLDAIFLAMASANQSAFFHLGPMDLNMGHVYLTLLSVGGSALWIFPKALDPTVEWYAAARRFLGSLGKFMKFTS